MSYQYTVSERRRRTTSTGGYGYSGSRSTFGYWIPLTLTVTAATIGLVAWIWSERRDDEEDSSEDEQYLGAGPASMSGALPAGGPWPPGPQGFPGPPNSGMPGPPQPGAFQSPPPGVYPDGARSTAVESQQDPGLLGRMSSTLGFGRSATPSGGAGPTAQQYDWTNKPFASGVAAAGAMVGAAFSTISGGGGGGEGYEDHERWSEEAEQRDNDKDVKQGIRRQGTADEFFSGSVDLPKSVSLSNRKRKTVAIVVSAVGADGDGDGDSDFEQHASILAHLPEYVDPDTSRLFVLIYTPDLRTHPLNPAATRVLPQSMTSSFSNISQTDLHTPTQTPGEYPDTEGEMLTQVEPNPINDSSSLYKTLHNQAATLVDKDSMILPYTSSQGHKHILRSLAPEIVYIQESLCGHDGEIISDLSGWVRQTIVVIGDEAGHGGLIDTDDESGPQKTESWWQKEERTGLGKRVTVVESLKIGDDWQRRVNERD